MTNYTPRLSNLAISLLCLATIGFIASDEALGDERAPLAAEQNRWQYSCETEFDPNGADPGIWRMKLYNTYSVDGTTYHLVVDQRFDEGSMSSSRSSSGLGMVFRAAGAGTAASVTIIAMSDDVPANFTRFIDSNGSVWDDFRLMPIAGEDRSFTIAHTSPTSNVPNIHPTDISAVEFYVVDSETREIDPSSAYALPFGLSDRAFNQAARACGALEEHLAFLEDQSS